METTGIALIEKERREQIEKHGFTIEKDSELTKGQLLQLARYMLFSNDQDLPREHWAEDYIKQLHMKSRIEQLAVAGALIAADIDRRIFAGEI